MGARHTCATCAFFHDRLDRLGDGQCRFEAPAIVGMLGDDDHSILRGVHPLVPPNHWCGRWVSSDLAPWAEDTREAAE